MIPLFRVHMPPRDQLLPQLERVLYSGYIGQGPQVDRFERELARVFGWPRVLTVNSGTSAIQLALRLANVRGGEVVTTPMTCTATNMPILAEGGRPVWADINPVTGSIDPADVERKIGPDTRAILTVHWGGQPCDLAALNDIAEEHQIPLIEDAAHALGAKSLGLPVGSGTADFSCFSLQAIKHITTVDGGILTTRTGGGYHLGRLLRWYGLDRTAPQTDMRCEQDVTEWGHKWHMNDVTATIGLAQLPHLERIVAAHRENAAFYDQAFKRRVRHVKALPGAEGAWWLYTLLLDDADQRERFVKHMGAAGVAVSQVHTRNDTHTCFAPYRSQQPLRGMDEFTARMVCIPVHWALTEDERQQVADAVLAFQS